LGRCWVDVFGVFGGEGGMFFLLLFVVWKADGVIFFGGLELSRSVERLTAHFELFLSFRYTAGQDTT